MITGIEFLTLAEEWVQEGTEAHWRSALSRAYYAAFHKARRLLVRLGFRVPRADRAHAYLWLRLSNCGDPTIQRAGSNLRILRMDRNHADYDIDLGMKHAQERSQIDAARKIIECLDLAEAEPTRTQIIETIRTYESEVLKEVTWQPGP